MTTSGHPVSGFSGVRRRIPRYPVAIPVDVTVLRSGTAASIPGRSLDLGEGGVAAVLAAELELGEWVGVHFLLPNAAQALETKAVVRHRNQLRCGFEFLGLSADQRSMIRRWAGTSQPLKSSVEPAETAAISKATGVPAPVPLAPAASASPASAKSTPSAPPQPPAAPSRRSAVLRRPINAAAQRLLRLTAALLIVVGIWAAWQWHRGWQQLEARMTRNDAHAQSPTAKVPADVMDRLLVRRVEPVYPEAARKANLQGVVVLNAVIAADGTVVNIRPLSGPDGLVSAAMDAARWWRYRPYRIRGEAEAVETTLSIEFRP